MTDTPNPTDEPTWEDVVKAIGSRLWELAPDVYRESRHRDLTYPVSHQNMMWAVRKGIDDVLDAGTAP